MASWLDSVPQLTSFHPYIQQFPTEAAVQVGVEKQRRYDEGVQRIQSQIEKIAGLDVIRPQDKAYLRSKLNQLSGDLTKVSMGDFSNFQLVNSVGGMINSISKDDNIQNAVANTARYKSELAIGDQLRRDGKLSPNREWDFSKSVESWFNDPNLKAGFGGQYREHIDVNKKVLDIIQKLHPKASVQDIPYALNSDGSINTKSIAAAMQRQGIKGIDEGQIRTAINSMLDPNDIDELHSQGRYNYRNYDVNSLTTFINEDYARSRQYYQNTLSDLKKRLTTATNINEQVELNNSIRYFEKLLGDPKLGIPGSIDINHQSNLQEVMVNPDGVRANLFTKNYIDQVSNGFAYREVTNELIANPLREDQWKQIRYNFDVIKDQNENLFKQANLELRRKEYELRLKKAGLSDEQISETPYFVPEGEPSKQNIESLQNWTSYNSALKSSNEQIVDELVGRNSSINNKLSRNDILRRIDEYKNNPEEYTPKTLSEKAAYDRYLKNATILDQMDAIYKETESQVAESYQRRTNERVAPLSEQLSEFNDLVITTPSGDLYFSPKEVYDYLRKETSKLSGGPVAAETIEIEDSKLSDRERLLKSAFANRYGKSRVTGVGTTGSKYFDEYIQELESSIRETGRIQTNIDIEIANRLSPLTGTFAPERSAIEFEDENARKNFISTIANVITTDIKGRAYSYDAPEALKLLTSEALIVNFAFRRQGENNYIVISSRKDATEKDPGEHIIKVEDEFVRKNKALGESYLNKGVDIAQVLLINNGSTNIFDDFDHAYYKAGEFGSYDKTGRRTVTLPIAADIRRDGDQAYVTYKLRTSNMGVLEFPYYLPINIQDFETKTLPSLTNEEIIRLFSSQLKSGTEINTR